MNAKTAPFLCKRCSRSSAFVHEANEFPLKARYSGGVWGGEGCPGQPDVGDGNAREAGTPGQSGTVRRRPGSPGSGGGDGSSGTSGRIDHNGTGIEGTEMGSLRMSTSG
jgi:hypothetical protein